MKAERWQRIEELFQAALEREGAEREAWLAAACAGDEGLRGEVEALLAALNEAGSFMETPAAASAVQTPPDARAAQLTTAVGISASATDPRATNVGRLRRRAAHRSLSTSSLCSAWAGWARFIWPRTRNSTAASRSSCSPCSSRGP